jgi:hypothetical protein
MESSITTKEDLDTRIFQLREILKAAGEEIKDLVRNKAFYDPVPAERDVEEMRANIKLAYRHMEDARMRLGKTVQAYDGGKSCYDK